MTVKYNIEKCTVLLGQEAFINIIIDYFHLQDACPINTSLLLQIDLTLGQSHISLSKLTQTDKTLF